MKLFVSAGEVSGDVYGAGLLQALQRRCQADVYGLGGPWMVAQGLRLLADVRSRAAVGLSENAASLGYFWQLRQRLVAWLRQLRPAAVILIDFQGLNLQLARSARAMGIPVIYYIAPQDWLWRTDAESRALAASVDLLLAVFPPEAEYYRQRGLKVVHVGHPLLDTLPALSRSEARRQLDLPEQGRIICWMPGSRRLEVQRLLPVMRALQPELADVHLMPLAADFLGGVPGWARPVGAHARYTAMLAADAVIGASGNMVLEAALLGRPVLAMYRVSPLTYAVARNLLTSPWVTLPNILLQRALVPEYLQRFPLAAIRQRLASEITAPERWQQAAADLRQLLGPDDSADRAAAAIVEFLA